MILDTSALIAILRNEPDAAVFARTIDGTTSCRISAVNFLEASIVIDGSRDPIASRRFDELIAVTGIVVEAVTEEQARIGRLAYRDFGKGSTKPN